MGNFGPAEMLVIGVFALLVFGPERLPEIARQVGRALREFKKVSSEFTSELDLGLKDGPKPPADGSAPAEPKQLKPGPR